MHVPLPNACTQLGQHRRNQRLHRTRVEDKVASNFVANLHGEAKALLEVCRCTSLRSWHRLPANCQQPAVGEALSSLRINVVLCIVAVILSKAERQVWQVAIAEFNIQLGL